jgi:hypothetical protein
MALAQRGRHIPLVTFAIQKAFAIAEKAWNKITAQLDFRHQNPTFGRY